MPNPQTKTVGNTVYTMFTVEKSGVLFFSSLEEQLERLVSEGAVDFKIALSGDHWIVTAVRYSESQS